jgi:hypothetical protein
MTIGEDGIKLPDGEELVVIDREDSLGTSSVADPREKTLDLRRQAGARLPAYAAPSAPRASSAHRAT